MSDVLRPVMQLLEGSVDAAVILDRERRILYYNRAYEASCALRPRELATQVKQGARCFEVFPLEICENACLGCNARQAGRPLRVDEIKAKRGDGEKLTFIVTAVPLADQYVVETYRDVTADVRIQRRLKVLLDRERHAKEILEEKVVEATRELRQAQAQLVHQEKMSSLGRLVAGIAHELNNPINFVYGNVDFLGQYVEELVRLVRFIDEAEDLPERLRNELERLKKEIEYDFLVQDSRKLLRSIRSGAERTAGIVRDLKTFSRAGGGELQEADMVAGIETTLNLIAPLLKNRITVERRYAPGLPRLVCNAGHINQVFMNILTNAAQAVAGEGRICVEIDTINSGRELRVRVSDSGPGISPEILEKITDPFFTTKEVGEGTGLGLWISENIVRAHGGRLTCESSPGVGATFIVTLPVRGRGGDESTVAEPAPAPGRSDTPVPVTSSQ